MFSLGRPLKMATGALALFAINFSYAAQFSLDDSAESFRKSAVAECSKENIPALQSICATNAGRMYRLYDSIKLSKSGKAVIQACMTGAQRTPNPFYSLLVCVNTRNTIANENPFPGLSAIMNEKPNMLDYWSSKCNGQQSRSCMSSFEADFSAFWSLYQSLNGKEEQSPAAQRFLKCLPLDEVPSKWNFGLVNNCVRKAK